MPKPSVDLETWSSEALIVALLESSAPDRARPAPAASASEMTAALLHDLGGLGGLARATVDEIEEKLANARHPRVPSRVSARRIAAAFELGRRAANDVAAPSRITSSADVAAWASSRLCGFDHEELWLLALDGRSRLRAVRCVAKGGLHGMGVRPADPLRIALRAAASGFVLVHNHPSGDPTPSAEDVTFTRRVAAAAAVVGMPLLDHVVVAREGFASVPFSSGGEPLAGGAVDA
jgi:DNA repair protein RadC